jgi:HAD superfamily hydrolase (TIGR01549 family)
VTSLVLFDLDNTLVDRQGTYRRWAESFAGMRDLDEQALDWLCEADNDGFAQRADVFALARERFGLQEDVEDLVTAYWSEYPSFYRPDPLVTEALERIRASGWLVGIVTNGSSTQHVKVTRAGLSDFIDACCVSEEIGVQKPDRRIFDEALRRCGRTVSTDPAWMVGDAPGPDISGGREAGLRTIWMHRGRQWAETDYRPDAEVGTIRDAVELMLAW